MAMSRVSSATIRQCRTKRSFSNSVLVRFWPLAISAALNDDLTDQGDLISPSGRIEWEFMPNSQCQALSRSSGRAQVEELTALLAIRLGHHLVIKGGHVASRRGSQA